MNRDFERIGRSFQIRFSILGCAEEVWYGWRDSDRGIIYRRWHATARDFGANSGVGLGFFCALAGSRHTAGVIKPMTGEGAPSWRSPDWPERTACGAVRCSHAGRDSAASYGGIGS